MLSLRRGSVTAVTERHEGLVRLEVDGRPCVAYPGLTGPVALGDDVLVNVQAVELGLGSGGFDLLYANLTRGLDLDGEPGAHVMKLPYSPLQHAVRHAEEEGSELTSLNGLPIVYCSLHSQVAPAAAGLGEGKRVAYVQVPGGALPVSLSDTVRALRERGLVEATVAVGACIEGDLACVSAAAAFVWAEERGFDAVLCSIGPGIVGTASPWGHGGVALVEAVLTLAGDVDIGWPEGLKPPQELERVTPVSTTGWEEACAGLPLAHMGRGAGEDPWFFAVAYAAGRVASAHLR
jgi:hypothetical protein